MPTPFTKTTLSGLYNDDFEENLNYHQILFNSGRALQARELTQMQTMMYAELSRLGRNIFKEGAAVSGGVQNINAQYDFVQIVTVNQGGSFTDIPQGAIFSNGSLLAKVIEVKSVSDPSGDFGVNTLYIQYLDGGSSAVGSEPPKFQPANVLYQQNGSYEIVVASTPTGAEAVTGQGVRIDVDAGDFFVLGRFVKSVAQSKIISPYSPTVNTVVGFKVIQEVVSVNDGEEGEALYDNAGGLTNTASPGADRYRIYLELCEEDDVQADETFVFLSRIENGKIVEETQPTDGYNKINDLLALRTREESGNYIVNPFSIEFDSADESNLSLTVSAGTAYVNGYRANIPSAVELTVPRSIGVGETVENEAIPVSWGNYTLIDSAGKLPDLITEGTGSYAEQNLYDGSNATIGTARVRGIEKYGDQYKLYLLDVAMNAGSSFSQVKAIGEDVTKRYIIDGAKTAQLFDTTNNDLLMPTPRPRAQSLDDIVLIHQKSADIVAAGGNITMATLTGLGEAYTNTGSWLVQNTDPGIGAGAFLATVDNTNPQQAVINGGGTIVNGETYRVIYFMQKTATVGQKVLIEDTGFLSNGITHWNFPQWDVVEVIQVTQNGEDITDKFIFDDGQRDNYYLRSRLYLKDGETIVASPPPQATFKYLDRSSPGDFYAASSYAVRYADIPTHTLQDGTQISLRNYLDFRPDRELDADVVNIKYLPMPGSTITADVTYHLPRADKILLTEDGDIQVLMGQQSRDPQLKQTPSNTLELYQVLMNANTASPEDLQVKPLEYKLYTMADIAKLDNKVEELKQYTELNIAELRAFHEPSLDSDGLERVDAGIQIDDLGDQTGSATEDPDYSASIDPENALIRPKIDEDNIRLVKEETLSSGVTFYGDNAYLAFDSAEWQIQSLASRSVNPNPFGMVDNVGVIRLSPSTDEWKDAIQEAVKAVPGANRLAAKQAFLYNNHQWNWKGRAVEDRWQTWDEANNLDTGIRTRNSIEATDLYRSGLSINRNAFGYVRRVVQRDTLRKTIGKKIIDVALIPWMRSRKVYFKAQGLTPNTKFTPFFDGVDVSAWCKNEASFVRWSDRTDDQGNQFTYNTLTGHPDTAEDLISDANGEIIGSFFIPNLKPDYYVTARGKSRKIKTNYLRFRAGVREFKLLDIDRNDWASANSKAFAYYTALGSLQNPGYSTRGRQYRWPIGVGFAGFPAAYSPQELKSVMDTVAGSSVAIVNPQLAGQYSPDTSSLNLTALNNLAASGQMSQVLSDYVTVNKKQFVGNAIRAVALPQNPLAQTFYVDNQFGVMLSKISLYFKSAPAAAGQEALPISIHIRPVENGKPSNTEIVPDSHVFLNASQVRAIGTSPTLDVIQASPTEFVFDEPVLLQPWTHYAVVISTQSTAYELFSAKTLDFVINSDEKRITTQPAPGSLFLPQNGVNWIESKDQDLMMRIARCKFTTAGENVSAGGSVILVNAPLPAKLLDNNPIKVQQIFGATTKLFVKAPCHGLAPGDTAQIDGVTDFAGLDPVNINTTHTVDSADLAGFTITIPQVATGSISGGGSQVLARRNVIFDVANPNIETQIPKHTSIDYSAKFITGAHVNGNLAQRFRPNNEPINMSVAKYERISPDENIEFDFSRAIYSDTVTDVTSGLGSGTPNETHSCYFKLDLKSSNDYVSPVVDLQRASMTLIGECIDDPISYNQVNSVAETEPGGGSSGSKHITAPVTLEVPGVGLDIRCEASMPTGAYVDCYYRTCGPDQNLAEQNWVQIEPTSEASNSGSNSFQPRRWVPGGPQGNLPQFNQSQVKLVMRGQNKGPILKNLKIRNLAT